MLLGVLAWPLFTASANGPGPDVAYTVPQPLASMAPAATLTREGEDLIITGSVAMLFNSGSFSGPNRAEKSNRARLTPDGVTVSSGFESLRTHLGSLRTPKASAGTSTVAMAQPKVASSAATKIRVISVHPNGKPVLDQNGDIAYSEVQVASLGPADVAMPAPAAPAAADAAAASPALNAIDQVVPMAPMPMAMSTQLAYARETAPPTAFDLVPDKDKYGDKVTAADIKCMTDAIYFESRGESYRGQVAVGQVVMNRLAHPIYPKTICQVVYQNQHMRNACQFSFACDGIPETVNDQKSWKQAGEIALGVINGSLYLTEVGKATHYHATYVYPDWAPRLKRTAKIGHHIFYQFKRRA
jgi:spore germination cell wall hydrolase CwlJ-like protein